MIDILLVDDELLVRTGIKMLIDWKAEDFRIAGEAGNGSEALDLLEIVQPDLILTDIQMPGMNGIELMNELKKRNFPGTIAVLSNHDDFQYTRQAIRCGAADYILKTDLNRENFLGFIRSLKKKIPINTAIVPSDRDPRHKGNILKEVLLCTSSQIRKRSIESLNPPWTELTYRPGILQIRQPSAGNEEKMTIFQITEGIINGSKAFFYDPGPERNYWILLFYGKKEELRDEKIKALEKRLRNSLTTYLSLPVFLGVGPVTEDLNDLNKAYIATEEILWESFFHPGHSLGFEKVSHITDHKKEISYEFSKELKKLISDNSLPEEKMKLLTEIFLNMSRTVNAGVLKNVSLQFIAYLNRQKAGLAMEDSGETPRQLPLCSLWQLSSLEELEKLFQDALKGIQEQGKHQPVDLISRCLTFIEKNLNRPLSLLETAEQSGLSGSYFSNWFKEKTGENFSDYLIRKRIEKARMLLESRPELRIYEIAPLCGIPNEKYFSRLFKIHTGYSPREYRKGVH